MFNRERPPHCEALSNAQVALVRKICKAQNEFDVIMRTRKAVLNGWYDVLTAVLRQKQLGYSAGHAAVFREVMTQEDKEALATIAPLISGFSESVKQSILFSALYDADWPEAHMLVLPYITNTSTRAAAVEKILAQHKKFGFLVDGDVARIIITMIRQPIDLHYNNGALMKKALRVERVDIAGALLENGFDLRTYAADINDSTRSDLSYDMRLYLQEQIDKSNGVTATASQGTGFLAPDGDSITHVENLSGGGRLSSVFNFALRQQTVIAETAGNAVGVQVVPFAHMADIHAVRVAAAAFVRGGGAPALVADFTDVDKQRAATRLVPRG